ncbi:hypothetical protein [Oceanicella actignis]|uniref:hypothetical protein n=1 Tax=Oceanicella actignis TaxID=1189325 RepID=UPI001253CC8C|nr:hypothetical protein [Oceanicella actignis]TYO89557.1 hypothetical protein LY05_01546 [Oceanicella actignis]
MSPAARRVRAARAWAGQGAVRRCAARARRALAAALALSCAAAQGAAQEGRFAAGSQAASWGLAGEEKARFEARVTDILCELTGDCPPDCGGGRRQLGLVRTADGALIAAAKNAQPVFSGAVADLAPYCGQVIEVDGLMVGADPRDPTRVFMVQRIRAPGAAEFAPANRFTRAWDEAHPALARLPGPWFRKDPRILSRIARDGWLGLGPAADADFLARWFE